jgi:hypothetical protein
MSNSIKTTIDAMLGPGTLFAGSLTLLTVLYLGRCWFARPVVAGTMLVLSLMFFGLSLRDPQFAAVVLAPDNIPVVAMLYLLGFFTWLATSQAVANDRRIVCGEPPMEKLLDRKQPVEKRGQAPHGNRFSRCLRCRFGASPLISTGRKVFAWPDLVYSELICAVVAMTLLVAWSLAVPAPLEAPANPAVTPNPSKAPWYFLGVQELLFYSDAWLAGTVVPCAIVLGLMAIPYLDFNPEGSGYYTIARRRFAYVVFQFGFWQLWILMILVGVFFRGPNWGFFGLYEVRDSQQLPVAENGHLPTSVGMVLLAVYFLGIPPLLGRTLMRDFRRRMGFMRFTLLAALLLLMLALPLKMLLQWTLHIRYIVALPECSLSF